MTRKEKKGERGKRKKERRKKGRREGKREGKREQKRVLEMSNGKWPQRRLIFIVEKNADKEKRGNVASLQYASLKC